MRKTAALFALGLLLAGCTSGGTYMTPSVTPSPTPTPIPSEAKMQPKVIRLMEQNKSGQSGTAIIEQSDPGKTKVTITLTGAKSTVAQPAHFHAGACPKPGAVTIPLNDVVSMKSETTLDMRMADVLVSNPELAINVHKSAAEATIYTSCGDVK